jgi:hypothetical protein
MVSHLIQSWKGKNIVDNLRIYRLWFIDALFVLAFNLRLVIGIACFLLTLFSPALAQPTQSTKIDQNQRDLIAYCYVLTWHQLNIHKADTLETLKLLRDSPAKSKVESLSKDQTNLKERRLAYLRGRLEGIGINPNERKSLDRFASIVKEDLIASLLTPEEDQCTKRCMFAGEKILENIDDRLKTCSQQCLGKTSSQAVQRVRACNSLINHIN